MMFFDGATIRPSVSRMVCACGLMFLVLCAVDATVWSDTIELRDSTISMRDCDIQAISHGTVRFIDRNGQPRRLSYQEIESIGIDGLAALDEAEQHLGEDDLDEALDHFLKAFLQAESDTQRAWIHSRLALVHDLRGEYVASARHFAGLMLLDAHPSWVELKPIADPDEPSFAVVAEAFEVLQRASKRIENRRVRDVIDRMSQRIGDMYRRMNVEYGGPRFEPGTTLSGIPRREILRESGPATQDHRAPRNSSDETSANNDSSQNEAAASDDLDALLQAKEWRQALRECRALAEDPSGYSIAKLLYQYGRSLQGADQPRDAAVKYTRCAVHYPQSRYAGLSLIETARIYRDHYRKPMVARRLVKRARRAAEAGGYDDVADRANLLLRELGEESN